MALAGMDIVCMARTGSGKTCVFLLPMIQKLREHKINCGIRGLVLSPTRELALQTFKFAKDMSKFCDLRIISGDMSISAPFTDLLACAKPTLSLSTSYWRRSDRAAVRCMHFHHFICDIVCFHSSYFPPHPSPCFPTPFCSVTRLYRTHPMF